MASVSGEDGKGLGRCTDCGRVFPVTIKPDGSLFPIGMAGGCHCGSTEVSLVSAEDVFGKFSPDTQ